MDELITYEIVEDFMKDVAKYLNNSQNLDVSFIDSVNASISIKVISLGWSYNFYSGYFIGGYRNRYNSVYARFCAEQIKQELRSMLFNMI